MPLVASFTLPFTLSRPDVNAICHSHAPAIVAVCCLEGGLQIFDQRGGAFVPTK